jgi:hypothetical protein
VVFAYLFEQVKKLSQTLADNLGISANTHKVCVSVPAGDDMDVQMTRQSRPGASAEIHPNVEAVRFYRQRECLLGFPDQQDHFKQLLAACLVEVGDVSGRRYQQVAIIIGEAIQNHDTSIGSPQHEVCVIILSVLEISADKTARLWRAFAQVLNILNPPRRP